MKDARAEMLERVRRAILGSAAPEPIRTYRRSGTLAGDARTELFCSRVVEYGAEARLLDEGDVGAAVTAVCRRLGSRTLAVPAALPSAWRPTGIELVEDAGLTPRELDRIDGTLTGCGAAVAETGTIVLTTGPEQGRRVLTLVPDLHICVVQEAQICQLLPEALELLRRRGLERYPITFVSGPSATSDIELSRVEGVHGPRNLVVLVTREVT